MKTAISATSNRRRRLPRTGRGFTLIELLVVLAMLALVVSLVPPAFDRLRESMQYRDTLRRVLGDLRSARQQAVAQGREVRFSVDLAGRSFGVEGRPQSELPESLQVRFTAARIETTARQKVSIRFHPHGGATGGSVDLVRASGAGTRLSVDWLSGAVSQSALGS